MGKYKLTLPDKNCDLRKIALGINNHGGTLLNIHPSEREKGEYRITFPGKKDQFCKTLIDANRIFTELEDQKEHKTQLFLSSVKLTCPFCGGNVEIVEGHEGDDGLGDIWKITCEDCPAEMRGDRYEGNNDLFHDELLEIIAFWKSRVDVDTKNAVQVGSKIQETVDTLAQINEILPGVTYGR